MSIMKYYILYKRGRKGWIPYDVTTDKQLALQWDLHDKNTIVEKDVGVINYNMI